MVPAASVQDAYWWIVGYGSAAFLRLGGTGQPWPPPRFSYRAAAYRSKCHPAARWGLEAVFPPHPKGRLSIHLSASRYGTGNPMGVGRRYQDALRLHSRLFGWARIAREREP